MRKTTKIGLAVAALASVGAVGVAWEQAGGHSRGGMGAERMFELADADKDGRLTRAELDAYATTRFREVDTKGSPHRLLKTAR